MRYLLFFLVFSCLMSCHRTLTYDLQGHRGCRGIRPENTLPAFKKALQLRVTTLELDLVITADKQVVVSHEPYFSHKISLDPKGNPIAEQQEKEHNIYQMPYAEVKKYDVGSKVHPDFPIQKKLKAYKPLLSEVLELAEKKAGHGKAPIRYNVEIKRHPDYDGLFHPDAATFVDLVLNVLRQYKVLERTTIQSFDIGALEATHRQHPQVMTAYLIGNQETVQENLSKLSFKPDIYSPYFELVTNELVKYCQSKDVKVIPWTVNKQADFESLLKIGVDGIITDYPNLARKWSK